MSSNLQAADTNDDAYSDAQPADATPARIEAHLLSRCDAVVARAKVLGATGCEVYAEHLADMTASIEQNGLKGASTAMLEAIGIRVLVETERGQPRQGFAYVNRLDDSALEDAIRDALSIARASAGDPSNGLVEPVAGRPIMGLFDPGLAGLTVVDAVNEATALVQAARKKDKRVSIDSGSFSVTRGHTAIVSSTGVRLATSETTSAWGLFGMAVDGEDVGSFDSRYDATRERSAIDVKRTGSAFAERVLALMDPRPGRTYRGQVLFSNEAFEEVFLEALLGAVDGDAVWRGKSRLKEKLGHRIASEGFTLLDDGTLGAALGSAAFDREGLPHRRTPIVGDGVLHTFLFDSKSARRSGRRSTAHASGGARSLPGVGTTNVIVAPGDASDDALLKELGTGLLVGRFSGDVDPISGDFSGVAKGSFRVEKGRRGAPVRETLIAGNVFDALQKIRGRGATLHSNMATQCPWILVDGIDVTAVDA